MAQAHQQTRSVLTEHREALDRLGALLTKAAGPVAVKADEVQGA
jgi:hypothetical protein